MTRRSRIRGKLPANRIRGSFAPNCPAASLTMLSESAVTLNQRGPTVNSTISMPDFAVSRSRFDVTLSRWVNAPLPPFHELLSAHDVARLTRRPKIVISGLMWLGRFPKRRRFRGRQIGWLRADVLDWMAQDLSTEIRATKANHTTRRSGRQHPQQACLPLGCRGPCNRERR
jgi:predicted DNA-binding transcriptional regulator AlpA